MMKRSILTLLFLVAAVFMFMPLTARADQELTEYQIAAFLMKNSNGDDTSSMYLMGDVLHNRMLAQQSQGNTDINYSDILFQSSDFSGMSDIKGMQAGDISAAYENQKNWEAALNVARQTTEGSVASNTNGANAFSTTKPVGKNVLYSQQLPNGQTVYYYNDPEVSKQRITHNESLSPEPAKEKQEHVEEKERVKQTPTPNSDGEKEAGACKFSNMKKIYMDDTKNENMCWYCNVVVILMNAFFTSAAKALPTTISLGKLLLELGFLIWLAYFVLQQVSSFEPVTTGKMLQEILKMAFKVAIAYAAVEKAGPIIAYYFINPVLDMGISYGLDLFHGLSGGA